MITQTLAIFLDAYRELNSRKMFWTVLILSAIVMIAFAFLGVRGNGLYIFGFKISQADGFMSPTTEYKLWFSSVVIGFWLTWVSIILAIISTSSIFPDFISGGSIDLFLSKPIGRLRLFLTKYLSGLLFVFLQVLIFCIVSFFVIGIRGKIWMPTVFLAIPIILLFFSYLFAIEVLVGVVTRSTLAALSCTILFWFLCFGIGRGEEALLQFKILYQQDVARYNTQIQNFDARIERLERPTQSTSGDATPPSANPAQNLINDLKSTRANMALKRDDAAEMSRKLQPWHRLAYWAKTIIPKTGATADLFDHWMINDAEWARLAKTLKAEDVPAGARFEDKMHSAKVEVQSQARNRSLAWILGTSLAFEALIVALAALIFVRRDY